MFNGKKTVGIVPYALDYGVTEDRYADRYDLAGGLNARNAV